MCVRSACIAATPHLIFVISFHSIVRVLRSIVCIVVGTADASAVAAAATVAAGNYNAAARTRNGTYTHSRWQRPCGGSCWSEWLLRCYPNRWARVSPDDVLALQVDVLDGVALNDGCTRKKRKKKVN